MMLLRRFLAVLVVGVAMIGGASAAPDGDLFVPLSIRYIDSFGIGAGLGWQSRASGLMLSGQVTWDRIDGVGGTTTYDPYSVAYHRPVPVAFSTPDRGEVGLTFTIGIPLTSRYDHVPRAR